MLEATYTLYDLDCIDFLIVLIGFKDACDDVHDDCVGGLVGCC